LASIDSTLNEEDDPQFDIKGVSQMTHKLTCAAALGLALGMLVSAPIAAQESAAPCRLVDYDLILRPDPEDTPTEVGIGIYVVSVDRVDTADQSFRLDAFVRSSWMDPRLAAAVNAAGVQSCRFPLSEVWEPRVFVFNQQAASALLPEVVSVDTEGRVRYLQRIQATLHAPMELEDFPLDRQLLPLTLISIEYGPESLSFHHDEAAARRGEDMTIPAWQNRFGRPS